MLPDVVYFGIEATHSAMCKFASKNSPGYLNVSTTIKGWVQDCPPVIQVRWEMEQKSRRQQREALAAEILDIYVRCCASVQATPTDTLQPPSTSNVPSSANTPGTSQGGSAPTRQQGLVQAAPPRTKFEPFEVEEAEEADYEMADAH